MYALQLSQLKQLKAATKKKNREGASSDEERVGQS